MREPWKVTREMFLSVGEVEQLLRALETRVADCRDREQLGARVDRLLIHILLFSGLRNSELCRLTLRDAVLEKSRPRFEIRGTPREDRTVYLPEALGVLVREYIAGIRPQFQRDGSPAKQSAPLLLNERGKAYERTALYRRVVRILAAAGLESRASVQLLRHTYGYLAYLRTGGNLLFVQRQLGHAHPMVTAVYAEFVEMDYPGLANAVANIPRVSSTPRPVSKRRDSRV